MTQHLRAESVLGTAGALTLWASGGVAVMTYWLGGWWLLAAVGVAAVGVGLLWGERTVARRNMRARLGYDWQDTQG